MPRVTSHKSSFHTTSWSLVVAAAARPSDGSALATLCQIYWHPVYAFIRRSGFDSDQAQDLTQGFFSKLLEKNYLANAKQERGRFRSFLLTAVKHFLSHERDRAQALKRGGGKLLVSIDPIEAELRYSPGTADQITPERLFELRWAHSVLDLAMVKLRSEFVQDGKAEYFDRLAVLAFGNKKEASYDELAAEMNIANGTLRAAVFRLRRKYRDRLRSEIAATVANPEDVDDEIRFLFATLGG